MRCPPFFHDYARWSDAELVETAFGGVALVQTRSCARCNKAQLRTVGRFDDFADDSDESSLP
jgi:hypothetical protein